MLDDIALALADQSGNNSSITAIMCQVGSYRTVVG